MKTLLLASLAVLSSGASVYADESPMAMLKRSHQRVDKLLRKPTVAASPEEKAVREEVKEIVNGFLDYEELARRALGPHWADRTRKEQQEFVAVLRDLIERNYVKQLRSNLEYQVDYRGETVRGQEATVHTVVSSEKNGRRAEIVIDYNLRRAADGRWLAWDIITDDVSLVRNYKSQFNRIISKESYQALVKKMKRKLEES